MRFSSSILAIAGFAPVALSAATCPAAPCKPGIYSQVANALKGFGPAQQYCTSKYPVPRQTCTSVALPTTITTTVATNTVQTTVATTTLTDTAAMKTFTDSTTETPTITSTQINIATETQTATVFTTTTLTVPANQKRDAVPATTVDPRSAQLSSLTAQGSAYVGSVCTCVATPATTTATTTPSSTTSVTATYMQSITARTTATVTPSTTITNTITALAVTSFVTSTTTTTTTTTTTSTITETVTAPAIPISPGCAASNCENFVPCGNNEECVCVTTTANTGVCVYGSTSCSQPSCSQDSACADGQVCAINTCCGHGVCVFPANVCPNSGSPAKMFRRKSWDGKTIGGV